MSESRLFTETYSNGLVLVGESIPSSRAAAFQFLIPAGAVTDPDDGQGSATVLADLSFRGAGSRDIRALSDALDDLGLLRGGGADLEYASFSGSLMAGDLAEALAIHADVLLRPHLPDDHVPLAQAVALHRIEALEDRPAQMLFVYLQEAYFPGPYGRSSIGTPGGIRSLTPERLRADHARRYRPDGAILGVAGRIDRATLVDAVDRLFGGWTGDSPPLPAPATSGRERYRHIPKETAQEHIGIAFEEVPATDPEFYDALMAVQVLSGGFASRLFTEVREKRGLVYSVYASNRAVREAGLVMGYAGTKPDRCQETLDVTIGEFRRLAEDITDEEVDRARTGLLSSLVMQGESTGARVGAITRDQFLRGRVRTLDEIRSDIERVTAASIVRHLRSHPPRDFTVVTVGPVALEVSE